MEVLANTKIGAILEHHATGASDDSLYCFTEQPLPFIALTSLQIKVECAANITYEIVPLFGKGGTTVVIINQLVFL